jgi:hypothetical protein
MALEKKPGYLNFFIMLSIGKYQLQINQKIFYEKSKLAATKFHSVQAYFLC